jgi:alpha-ribazole phosphatase
MNTNVLLVRHGQTESNVTGFFMGWSDEDINRFGYAQAGRLSSRLADLPIAAIYSSPLKRAYNTALVLAKPHQLTAEVRDDLVEIQVGDWQGLHIDEISQRWPELWQQSRIDPSQVALPNGESFEQVRERAVRAFNQIVQANQGRQVLMVTHDVVIRVIVAHILGTSNSIYRRFEIANASLSRIAVSEDRTRLVTLNDTSHLENHT